MIMKLHQILAPETNKIILVYMNVLCNIISPNFLGMRAYKSLS